MGNTKTPNPTGTGEYDYALLKIEAPLGTVYPHLTIATETDKIPQSGSVIVAGYPAGYITLEGLLNNLAQQLTESHIQDTYTFAYTTYDLMSIPAGALAQRGISGGVVTDTTGKVIGIVATAERRQPAQNSVVNAVTFSHINNSFKAARGISLASFITVQNRYAEAKRLERYQAQLAQGQATAGDGSPLPGTVVEIPWQNEASTDSQAQDNTTTNTETGDKQGTVNDGASLIKGAIPQVQVNNPNNAGGVATTGATSDINGEVITPPALQDFAYLSSLYQLPATTPARY